jgi:hypothetical protein
MLYRYPLDIGLQLNVLTIRHDVLTELVAMGEHKDAEWGTEEQGVRRNSRLKLGMYFPDEISNSVSWERNYAIAGFIGI